MKFLKIQRELTVPEGVKVELKTRDVTVTGPRGKLFRSFKGNKVDIVLITGAFARAEKKRTRGCGGRARARPGPGLRGAVGHGLALHRTSLPVGCRVTPLAGLGALRAARPCC